MHVYDDDIDDDNGDEATIVIIIRTLWCHAIINQLFIRKETKVDSRQHTEWMRNIQRAEEKRSRKKIAFAFHYYYDDWTPCRVCIAHGIGRESREWVCVCVCAVVASGSRRMLCCAVQALCTTIRVATSHSCVLCVRRSLALVPIKRGLKSKKQLNACFPLSTMSIFLFFHCHAAAVAATAALASWFYAFTHVSRASFFLNFFYFSFIRSLHSALSFACVSLLTRHCFYIGTYIYIYGILQF